MSNDDNILLRGLDGSNPLAFLAALGALRTLTLALPDETVRMSWQRHEGAWQPLVWCSLARDGDALVGRINEALVRERSSHPTRFIDYKSSNKEASEFFQSVREGEPIESEMDAWICSLTNDIDPEATSPLQLARSDYFAGNLDQIMANTTFGHLQRALLLPWRYDEPLSGQSLHLEPTEDRRYAYQWNQPSGDPNRNKSGNVLGANRLAIEAFPLFLGVPSTNPARLMLTGWTGVRSDDSTWTWPLWDTPCTLNAIKSVLALEDLQVPEPNSIRLVAAGILAVYRCRRILVEKTPNLTPSFAVI